MSDAGKRKRDRAGVKINVVTQRVCVVLKLKLWGGPDAPKKCALHLVMHYLEKAEDLVLESDNVFFYPFEGDVAASFSEGDGLSDVTAKLDTRRVVVKDIKIYHI